MPLPRVAPLRIGPLVVDPPVLQAPMAGFTNYAFRQIVREFGGAGLQATEMVHAKGFLWLEEVEHELPDRLWGVKDEPRPLAVQIWDNDPATLAAVGAKLAHEFRVSVVDINFGCPVKDVVEKAHSGSYLLRYPDRMQAIIERVVAACAPVPVTAKIRLGCSRKRDQCHRSGSSGRSGRCRGADRAWTNGPGLLQRIGGLGPDRRNQAVLAKIPLIGNGDLSSPAAVIDALRRYPVDGVMIARAALNKPWLFRQVRAALRGEPIPPDPTPAEERALLLHHYRLVCERFGESKGTILMRKYACCYAQGRPGAREFRTQVSRVSSPDDFRAIVERHFPKG